MASGSSVVVALVRYWKRLAHDWQAVVLGALFLSLVLAGVPIPW